MKSMLIAMVFSAMLGTPVARAQSKLDLYSDQSRTSCVISDASSPAIVSIYAFVSGPDGVTGVRFKAPRPACWTGATWVGDNPAPNLVAVGSSQDDWSVVGWAGLPFCPTGVPPLYVGAINFFVTGQAQACCELVAMQPVPFPFEYVDCSFREQPLLAGQKIVINPDASCPCASPVATEPSTWGRVKSLYC